MTGFRINYIIIYYFNIKFFAIFLVFFLKPIELESIYNFKTLYLSNDYYYIVTYNEIIYYNNATGERRNIYTLEGDGMITSEEESEMISYGIFYNASDIANLIIIKKYIYAIIRGGYACHESLNEIDGYPSELYPYKCQDLKCYYFVGIINSNNQLCLYLYKTPDNGCWSSIVAHININNTSSENFDCKIIRDSNEGNLICFYENESNEIIANIFNIELSQVGSNIAFYSSFTKPKGNNGAKIIKSELSQDNKKAFVCFINNDNDCQCLIELLFLIFKLILNPQIINI